MSYRDEKLILAKLLMAMELFLTSGHFRRLIILTGTGFLSLIMSDSSTSICTGVVWVGG